LEQLSATSPTSFVNETPTISPTSVTMPLPSASPPPFAPRILEQFHLHYPRLAAKDSNAEMLAKGVSALKERVTEWHGKTDEIEVSVTPDNIAVYVFAKAIMGSECVVTPTLSQHHGELYFDVTKEPRNRAALASLKHAIAIRTAITGHIPEALLAEPLSLKKDDSLALQKCYPLGDALSNAPAEHNELLGYTLQIMAQQLNIVCAFQQFKCVHNDLTLENLLTKDDGSIVASDFSEMRLNTTTQTDTLYLLINLHRLVSAIDPRALTPDTKARYNSLVAYLNIFVAVHTTQAQTNATALLSHLQHWAAQDRDYTHPITFNYFIARHFPGESYTLRSVDEALRSLHPTDEEQILLPLITCDQFRSIQAAPPPVVTYITTLKLPRTTSCPALLRA